VMPYCRVDIYRRFEGTCYMHLHPDYLQGDNRVVYSSETLVNGKYLNGFQASYFVKQYSLNLRLYSPKSHIIYGFRRNFLLDVNMKFNLHILLWSILVHLPLSSRFFLFQWIKLSGPVPIRN
jgi:hypothetical protein